MTIKLLSKDIPRYWELIKYAVITVEEVPESAQATYLRELLIALMSDKAQAWIRVDGSEIVFLYVTRILYNPQFDEKYLQLQVAFSWKRLDEEVWKRDLELMKEFAREQKCSYLGFMSRNPRIWQVAEGVGFVESTRIYAYRLG